MEVKEDMIEEISKMMGGTKRPFGWRSINGEIELISHSLPDFGGLVQNIARKYDLDLEECTRQGKAEKVPVFCARCVNVEELKGKSVVMVRAMLEIDSLLTES